MVLTRAFACTLPVVASDIPGYREVLDESSSLAVPPGDPAALADAVASLVADEPRRQALGEWARALARERYSWASIAGRLDEIYADVSGRSERRARAA
jgi:glycosyltransferase involved in cell wall biosynthesis